MRLRRRSEFSDVRIFWKTYFQHTKEQDGNVELLMVIQGSRYVDFHDLL